MIEATREAAHDLVDDLHFIRETLAKAKPRSGDLRRLSAQLRKILVEGELQHIAGPRMGHIHIQAPDLSPAYAQNEQFPWGFLSSGMGIDIYGMEFGAVGWEAGFGLRRSPPRQPEPIDQSAAIRPFRIEQFKQQKVLCSHGKWATRQDIIKFVANKARGVHPTKPITDPLDLMLHNNRNMIVVDLSGDEPNTILQISTSMIYPELTDEYTAELSHINIILLQVLSAAIWITRSPEVQELERIIADEG